MRLIGTLLLLLALLSGALPAGASTDAPPLGLTQQQYDTLADSISLSVAKRLKEQGIVVKPDATARALASEPAGDFETKVSSFVAQARQVLGSYPDLVRQLARIPGALDRRESGGRPLWRFLLILMIASCATLGAEFLVRRALDGIRRKLQSSVAAAEGWPALVPLIGLLATDAIALAAVGLVGYGMLATWLAGGGGQGWLAKAFLTGIFAWRLYLFAFRVVLRPDIEAARLAAMDNSGAVTVYERIALILGAAVIFHMLRQILLALQSPIETIAAGQILFSLGMFALFIWAARASREPMASWFMQLTRRDGPQGMGEYLARHWLVLALPFFLLLLVAEIYGAIDFSSTIPEAMILTLNAVIGLIFLKTLIAHLVGLHGRSAVSVKEARRPASSSAAEQNLADVVARCGFVAAGIGAITLVTETWIVDVLGLVSADGWRDLTRASFKAACTLFVAYVAWELVKFATFRYGTHPPPSLGTQSAGETPRVAGGASRLATLMPLMRIALAIMIFVVAGLIVLSELGVNITPLIAAASVFGLAISFGSQTLVRDIVSGIFYLADDAFRVGEYIDCGKAKGTVEGFTLRSIRLRHQNGQVHTIPFGQLGQITNFSRDWTGVKFNLRLALNTDLEKLSKTVKKIGQEMLEDPEMKEEFLEPLKMQGVADIADNAMIVGFKFTAKPGNPSLIQREAIRRMIAEFAAAGIGFAGAPAPVALPPPEGLSPSVALSPPLTKSG